MKLGVPLSINGGVRRSVTVTPSIAYTGPTGAACTASAANGQLVRGTPTCMHACMRRKEGCVDGHTRHWVERAG